MYTSLIVSRIIIDIHFIGSNRLLIIIGGIVIVALGLQLRCSIHRIRGKKGYDLEVGQTRR